MKNNLKSLVSKELVEPQDQTVIKAVVGDEKVLAELARQSMRYFFYVCFCDYIKYKIAPFHLDFFDLAQNTSLKRVGVIGFRNCAKSTILNTGYALWSVVGVQQKKHVVIVGKNQGRARGHLKNIRQEIEKNSILRKLVGPFREEEAKPWNTVALRIPAYSASITAISIDEGVRGLREGANRPDLIIVDDIEDSASAKTAENRDKVFEWLTHELLTLGNADTKIVFIGNFIHEDSALIRIETLINAGQMAGKFLRVPIIDDNDNIAWPGMFPSKESLTKFKNSIGSDDAWLEEFLLKPALRGSRVIQPEWIKYYNQMPDHRSPDYRYSIIGIDLAISEKTAADFTAMTAVSIFGPDNDLRICIHPNPINLKMDFPTTIETAKNLSQGLIQGIGIKLVIESNGYQEALVQQLQKDNFEAVGIKTLGDKRSRLSLAGPLIQNNILFPSKGAEDLIRQLIGFPAERHDDLIDSLLIALSYIQKNENKEPSFLEYLKMANSPEGRKKSEEIALKTAADRLLAEEQMRQQMYNHVPFNMQDVRRALGF